MTSEDQGGVAFFLVGEGSATVSVGGRGEVQRLGPGDFFGEMALITGETRSAAIVADTEVQCWALSQWHFKPLVLEHTEIAWALLEVLAAPRPGDAGRRRRRLDRDGPFNAQTPPAWNSGAPTAERSSASTSEQRGRGAT